MIELLLFGIFFVVIKVINLISMGEMRSIPINKNIVFLILLIVIISSQFFLAKNHPYIVDIKGMYKNLNFIFDKSNLEPLVGVTAPF
jgi:hypothetical protein